MSSEPVVGDMSITDEHAVVGGKATFADVCQPFIKSRDAAILIENPKTGQIEGVITLKDLLILIASGKNPAKEKISKYMRTKVVEMGISTPLSQALRMMAEAQPDAVVIRDPNGGFAGFFSPDDYRDATRRLESHQMISMRMQKSKTALGEARNAEADDDEPGAEKQNLLDTLLGDFEEEEEEPQGL
ncbi:MAG: CBS domain-containing protein [Candidatus Poseidoniales archaeon]|jgi:CBS domain-containing protein|tara:strand:+ start:394 stop:954 length:561 start_codon:yes stop_codon:yes gene_type:complete